MIKFGFAILILTVIFQMIHGVEQPEVNCNDPIYTGLCRASFPRFGYNRTLDECVEFVYGGCGANGNNFETKAACAEACYDDYDK